MICRTGAIGNPAPCSRSPCSGHVERTIRIIRHILKACHLIDGCFLDFRFTKITKVIKVITPITLITKVHIVFIHTNIIPSVTTHVIITKSTIVPVTSSRSSCWSSRSLSGSWSSIVVFFTIRSYICLGQVFKRSLGHVNGWPIVFTNDRCWRLQQASTSLTTNLCFGHELIHAATVSFNCDLDSFSVIGKAMHYCIHVGKREVTTLFENSHTFRYITQQQGIVITSHNILTHIRNLEHLAKFFCITSK
mmetsp:Transcript_19109/g.26484  ORF Transcript_19109/g.26484 Transcript_19109/m.26484 type:complete len:249 (+) Transcript_19109:938-1684(+)